MSAGPQDREEFFVDVRRCRRRPQVSPDRISLAPFFATPDSFPLLEFRATAARVQAILKEKNMWARDAFLAFDTGQKGSLTVQDLFAGLKSLGLGHLQMAHIRAIFVKADKNRDGTISLREFKQTFEVPEQSEGLDEDDVDQEVMCCTLCV